jgi:polysaccharide biosynthesis transport protein
MTTAPLEDHALADALSLLWARRFLLLLAVLGAGALALLISINLPKTYRATATLMVADAKMGGETPSDLRYGETYAALLRNPSIATNVVKALDLEPAGITPNKLTTMLGVRSVPGTLLISLYLEHGDAALAAKIVNAQATQAVDVSRAMLNTDLSDTRSYLQEQVASAQAEVKAREADLLKVKSEFQVESDTARLKRLVEVRGVVEEQYAKAAQDAAGAAQGAKAIRDALAGQSRLLTLNRQVVDDPALKEAAAADRPRTSAELLGLRMQEQVVNPLYEQSEPELVKASAEAAGATARRDAAQQQLKSNLQEIQALERNLAVGSTRLESAKREYELAKAGYETLSKSYERARLSVRSGVPELKLLHPAVADPHPVGPRIKLNVTIAVVASFILAVFSLLLGDYVQASRRPMAAIDEPDVEVERAHALNVPSAR